MPCEIRTPLILFGAFDRHNFGDLLLAHVAAHRASARFPGRPLVFAGVATRDMRPWGGHEVKAIAGLAKAWGDQRADLFHAGGELLTCSLYEAAVMVLSPEEAAAAIVRYDRHPVERQAWARARLGLDQGVAYLAPKALFRKPGRFTWAALGGVGLATLPHPLQAEVRVRLTEADSVSVRDRLTQAWLSAQGLVVDLAPDPGEQVAELFGRTIARHAAAGSPAAIRKGFPGGYVAIQFSADFGDDACLRTMAAQLDQLAVETGLGLCLFRAGAAPWHDDEAVYRRLMGFMQTDRTRLFDSLCLWDICALLAHARAYCGSSLHGRIVARAFGVPGVSLLHPPAPAMGKVRAYGETWWRREERHLVGPEDILTALRTVMDQSPKNT